MVIKSVVGRLPWGMRKLTAFLALYRPIGLLLSRPHFAGVYASFDQVPDASLLDPQVLVRAAERNKASLKRDGPTGLPLLGHSHSLLPLVVAMLATQMPIRILDFGGAAGSDFRNLTSAISDRAELDYNVVDLPEVCEAGRRLWQDDKRISFSAELPRDGAQFDLVYSSWAILYVPEPLGLLAKLASYNARAILLINAPFTRRDAFVRVQTNYKVPSWVLSLPDVERVMRECGYRLAFHVAGDVDHNVDNYPPDLRVSNVASLLFLKS